MHCTIVGAPIQAGSGRMGCEMGPSALRTAGLAGALTELGHTLTDLGTIVPADMRPVVHGNAAVKALPEIAAWTAAISETAYAASADAMPIFLGGDHSISAGTLAGIARPGANAPPPHIVLLRAAPPPFKKLSFKTNTLAPKRIIFI
ncbi:arginase family protein, partial [Mesorhizobium sp. M0500]|uniref:arginase family protein n=1 Tax=Mesorhizobium sp. M0500 TaxID=2956953 RepID=UPI003337B7A4